MIYIYIFFFPQSPSSLASNTGIWKGIPPFPSRNHSSCNERVKSTLFFSRGLKRWTLRVTDRRTDGQLVGQTPSVKPPSKSFYWGAAVNPVSPRPRDRWRPFHGSDAATVKVSIGGRFIGADSGIRIRFKDPLRCHRDCAGRLFPGWPVRPGPSLISLPVITASSACCSGIPSRSVIRALQLHKFCTFAHNVPVFDRRLRWSPFRF